MDEREEAIVDDASGVEIGCFEMGKSMVRCLFSEADGEGEEAAGEGAEDDDGEEEMVSLFRFMLKDMNDDCRGDCTAANSYSRYE